MPVQLARNLPALQRVPGGKPTRLLLLPLGGGEQETAPEAGRTAFNISPGSLSNICRHQIAVAQQGVKSAAQASPGLAGQLGQFFLFCGAGSDFPLHRSFICPLCFFKQRLPFFPLFIVISSHQRICDMICRSGQAVLQQFLPLLQQPGNQA